MTHSAPTSQRRASSSGSSLRGSLKGALAILALLLLMLFLWQVVDQFRRTLIQEREHGLEHSADLVEHFDLKLALHAQAARAALMADPADTLSARLERVRQDLPEAMGLLSLDGEGRPGTQVGNVDVHKLDLPRLSHDAQGKMFLYSNDQQDVLLLIQDPRAGAWLIRLGPAFYERLAPHFGRAIDLSWRLENFRDDSLLSSDATSAAPSSTAESLLLAHLANTDWQVRSLFDSPMHARELMPALLAKCTIALLCCVLPILALISLRRRQRQLHEGRRRYQDIFEGTGVALCVVDLAHVQQTLDEMLIDNSQRLLKDWRENSDIRQELQASLWATEANQIALKLFDVEVPAQLWRRLSAEIDRLGRSLELEILTALLEHRSEIEMQVHLEGSDGTPLHLWLLVSFPPSAEHRSEVILSLSDITDQVQTSDSLRSSEQRYRLLAESISDVIFSTDKLLQLNYVSPSSHTVLGYEPEWIFENGWQSFITNPGQLSAIFNLFEGVQRSLDDPERLAQLRAQLHGQMFMVDCLRADGRKIPMELRLVMVWDDLNSFAGVLGVCRDVSIQRRAEKDLRMAATVFEHSTSAILITDPAGYIVQVNEAFSRVSGHSPEEVLDQLPGLLIVDEQQAHLSYILKQLGQHGTWEGEVWLKRRSSEHYPAWVGVTAVLDDEGDLASYVCFFTDISERKASEQRIHRLAYYDALTHLPNRTLFQDRLHNALMQADRNDAWVVLMFLDLDRFKPINDSLGHAAGDRMLQDMASRLLACVDADDTVARMGGDEFTLLLTPCVSRETALNRAIHVGERILASLVTPFVLENREFFVTASIGIALSPQDGDEASQLMKNADTAMYHAKERGKNNFQFYQAQMNASALERLELESDLRHALEQDEFVLYYQPQLSGDGKRLTGTEALLRWRHPRRGLVPPGDFIPVLEELGLVVDVGDWVLAEACRQLKTWHENRVRVPKVSVNISARQFSDGQLGNRIANILKETGLPPACLELELTESILMREVDEAMQILDKLKKLGLSIAVDDFGTGYSSLNYLKQFPIDVLKIDRTFVDGLPEGEQDAQIARAIIAMAHSLNLSVIAEGVETHEQLDFLREHGCDEVQGYLFGRPMQASRFEAQFSSEALFLLE